MASSGGRTTASLTGSEQSLTPPKDARGTSRDSTADAAQNRPRDERGQVYRSVEERLFDAGQGFDFFQAVRHLERLDRERVAIGHDGPPEAEAVRFRAHISLNFPASAVYEILPATDDVPLPVLVETFFGLAGPQGVLPRSYTEMLFRIQRDVRGKQPEKYALRDWFDLFNHRLLSLFYRAWTKYRFYIPFERGEHEAAEPDAFTLCLLSLIGLGLPSLRDRLRITERPRRGAEKPPVLGHVVTPALLRYAGLLGARPRTALGLEAILADYFQVPVEIQQFHGKWLQLEPQDRSRLGAADGHCRLGEDLVLGERVWDVEGTFRIRLGPLDRRQFDEFLPDRTAAPERKAIFLAVQLTRLFVGPTLDFDVQLVVRPDAVPECRLGGDEPPGARLGWNTWLRAGECTAPVDDAVFAIGEVFCLNGGHAVA